MSGFRYRIRLTISPLLIAIGRTSRFFFPTSTVVHTKSISIHVTSTEKVTNTFNRPFMREVVLEQILTLPALELSARFP